jgi:hypothetical protein
MHPSLSLAIHRTRWALLAVAFFIAFPAQAQAPGCPELAEAQQRYDNGQFEEAIATATQCLEGDETTEPERQRAYRLIGLSYIGQDLRDNAREAVRQLIMLVPNFEPDPVNDPPQFIQMVEEAKAAQGVADGMEDDDPADDVAIVDAARRAEEERQAEEQRRREEAARQRAEANRRDEGGGITKWLLIGGAVVGGGALAAVLLSGGDGDGDGGGGGGGGGIALPPPLPGN